MVSPSHNDAFLSVSKERLLPLLYLSVKHKCGRGHVCTHVCVLGWGL